MWKGRKAQKRNASNVGYTLTFKGRFLMAAIKAGICPEKEDGSIDVTKAALLWDELYKDFAGPFDNVADVLKEERHSSANEEVPNGKNVTE